MKKLYILIIALISTVILAIYIYKDASLSFKTNRNRSYVIQENTRSIGYDDNKKVFDVQIKKVRHTDYFDILYAHHIFNGKIYNHKNDEVIDNLYGEYARINTAQKTMLVTNNVEAVIKPTKSKKLIFVTSNGFKYNHKKQLSNFFDGSMLKFDDKKIETSKFNYHNKTEILDFIDGFKLITKDSITTTTIASLDVNQSLIQSSKDILTTYQKKPKSDDSDQIKQLLSSPTEIKSKTMTIDFSDQEHSIVTYRSDILVRQINKTMTSDYLHLNFKDDIYIASSNITFVFNNLRWSIKKDRKISNKTILDMLNKKTIIKATFAHFSPSNNLLTLSNKVSLKQKKFKLICDQFIYDIDNELITASGNIVIYKYGVRYLKTKSLLVDIKKELFITKSGNEQSEFTIEI